MSSLLSFLLLVKLLFKSTLFGVTYTAAESTFNCFFTYQKCAQKEAMNFEKQISIPSWVIDSDTLEILHLHGVRFRDFYGNNAKIMFYAAKKFGTSIITRHTP